MESNIQIFNNESFGTIRVSGTSEEPLFCASDVCNSLGYSNSRDAVMNHVDEDDVAKCDTIDRLGRNQQVTYITESGLYSLIFSSKIPSAKKFKKWVTSEVLPSIRKTGSYSAPNSAHTSQSLSDQMKTATWAAKFLNLNDASKLLIAHKICDPMGLPLPEYVQAKDATLSATDLLKMHGVKMSANKFNDILKEKGILVSVSRKASGGKVKHFNSITKKGLLYGENQVSEKNMNETQPRWYMDKFDELLTLVGIQIEGGFFNEK